MFLILEDYFLNIEKNIHKVKVGSGWAKGLTAENDIRIKHRLESYNKNEKSGLHLNKPKTCFSVSEKIRSKISKKQKENYKGISRYATAREHRKSYAEQYFDTIFIDAKNNIMLIDFF